MLTSVLISLSPVAYVAWSHKRLYTDLTFWFSSSMGSPVCYWKSQVYSPWKGRDWFSETCLLLALSWLVALVRRACSQKTTRKGNGTFVDEGLMLIICTKFGRWWCTTNIFKLINWEKLLTIKIKTREVHKLRVVSLLPTPLTILLMVITVKNWVYFTFRNFYEQIDIPNWVLWFL